MSNKELNIIVKVTDQASKQLQAVSKDVESFAQRNQQTFQNMALGGAAALGGIALFAKQGVMAFSDYEESINAVNVMFGESSKAVKDFAQISAKEIGLSKTEFQQLSVSVGALLKNAGASTEELGDKTIELAKRAADMASVFNTSVPDAMSALNQALRGEAEAIRAYGGDVTDATMQTYLLSQGINKKVTELSQAEKTMYRYDMIMAQTAVTQNDFKNTSDGLANSLRIQEAAAKDTAISIGQGLKPALDEARAVIEPLLAKVFEWINANPELAGKIILVSGAIAGLVAILGTLGLAIPAIITGITAIGTAMMFLAANPIGLLITAVALLATAIYMYWDEIVLYTTMLKDKIIERRNQIVEFTKLLGSKISEIFTGIKEFFVTWWAENQELVKTGLMILLGVFTGGLSHIVKFIYDNWETIKMHFQNGLNSVKDLSQSVMDGVQGIFTSIFDTITNAVDTAVNYVVDKVKQARDSIKNFASNAISSAGQGFSNAVSSVSSAIPGFAEGGRPKVNKLSVVGERGPELFVPGTSGTIVPNNQLGPSINLTFGNFNGAERSDAEYIARVVEQKVIGAYNNYFAGLA